jgi:hypothetical protein
METAKRKRLDLRILPSRRQGAGLGCYLPVGFAGEILDFTGQQRAKECRGFPPLLTRHFLRKRIDDRTDDCAFGADDAIFRVPRLKFKFLPFYMSADIMNYQLHKCLVEQPVGNFAECHWSGDRTCAFAFQVGVHIVQDAIA